MVFSLRVRAARLLDNQPASRGRVMAVHKRSFETGFEQLLFNFHIDPEALHGFGILIPEPLLNSVREGSNVEILWPRIRIGTALLELAEIFPEFIPADAKIPVIFEESLRKIRRSLLLFGRLSTPARAFLKLEENDFSAAEKLFVEQSHSPKPLDLTIFKKWFGGGEGLTPAFDDIMAGILLADRWLKEDRVVVTEDFLRMLEKKTTRQSALQMKMAADGVSNRALERLLSRLPSTPLADAEIVRCLALGHSSGADILTGVYRGLSF